MFAIKVLDFVERSEGVGRGGEKAQGRDGDCGSGVR